MIPKEAIERAIEGGWGGFAHFEMFSPVSPTKWPDVYVRGVGGSQISIHMANVALDPSFWQALGKALGWEDAMQFSGTRFANLILISGDTEAFWKELLTSKE